MMEWSPHGWVAVNMLEKRERESEAKMTASIIINTANCVCVIINKCSFERYMLGFVPTPRTSPE